MSSKNQKRFNQLILEKQGKTKYSKSSINRIYGNAFRISRPNGVDTKTLEKQFVYENGKFVESGLDYHKVYTKNFKEYCFLGPKRAEVDIRIFPKVRSDFTKYSRVTKPKILNIFSEFKGPNPGDYRKGFFSRYFAQKVNQPSDTPFDISAEQFGVSPLYIYADCNWMISGINVQQVRKFNLRQIKMVSVVMPNLKNSLSPFQYYRKGSSMTKKQSI